MTWHPLGDNARYTEFWFDGHQYETLMIFTEKRLRCYTYFLGDNDNDYFPTGFFTCPR